MLLFEIINKTFCFRIFVSVSTTCIFSPISKRQKEGSLNIYYLITKNNVDL